MEIRIDTHQIELPETGAATISHRAARVLQRFRDRIARLIISLREDHGGRSSRVKVCTLQVDLRGGGQIVVVDRAASLNRAIARGLRRGKVLVGKEAKRRRRLERRRLTAARSNFPELAAF